jgi:cytochrome c5
LLRHLIATTQDCPQPIIKEATMKKLSLLLSIITLCAAGSALAADRSGKDVFAQACTACHTAGVMNAPKFGSKADWAPRVAKGKDTLYKHALSGFNAMPPKGTCSACTDKEIKNAVDYMVSSAK